MVVLTSTLAQTGAARTLSAVLNENWRGAYDILVRPAGQDLGAGSTQGFVEGNFVSSTGQGGISLAALAKIRTIPGVDVAAPIGVVGRIGYNPAAPILDIPDRPRLGTSALPPDPKLYKLGFTVSLTDAGGSSRVVYAQSIDAVLRRQSNQPDVAPIVADGQVTTSSSPDDGISVTAHPLPTFTSSVIAVDPVAEQKLLGASGAFLQPLTAAPNAKGRQANALASSPWFQSLDTRYASISGVVAASTTDGMQSATVVPLLVNNNPGAQLTLKATVDQSDLPITTFPATVGAVKQLVPKATFTPLGSSSKDLTNLLIPFATGNLSVPWPGSAGYKLDEITLSTANVQPTLIDRPNYQLRPRLKGSTDPGFTVQPRQLTSIDGTQSADGSAAERIMGVQSYRSAAPAPQTGDATITPTLNMPIASFSLKDLDFGQTAVSYVPFGAYDPARTVLTAKPDGTPVANGQQVQPNPSGLDFISPVPGAITDLTGAQTIRGDTPIDAIRIRVGGISSYTPAAQQKVVDVASRIQAMGLTVSVVAGSSPQPVNVYVPQYIVAANGSVSDLGWVSQDWTTLGAAVRVENMLSALSLLLLILALAVAAGLVVACAAAGRSQRVAQARLLAAIGWQRPQIVRWLLAPQAILLGLLTVLAVIVAAASGLSAPAVWSGGAAVAATAVGLLIVAASSAPRSQPAAASPRPVKQAIGSPWQLGVRHLRTRPGLLLVRAASWAVLSVAAAVAVLALLDASTRVGATRLAGVAVDRTTLANIALALITLVAGLILATLARRIEAEQSAGRRGLLRAAGWTGTDLRRLAAADTAATAVIAVLPALAGAAAAATAASSTARPVLAALAALTGLAICALTSLTSDARVSRR